MKFFDSVKKICLFLLTFFIIDFSPNILNEIQPDSGSYLNLNPTRQTTYYIVIYALDLLGIDLIFFQKIFLSLSITVLIYLIKKKTNIYFSIIVYVLIVSNIYYTSFSKTILTESLFLSLINLSIFFLFNLKTKLNLIFFSLCCGIIASLKPIGIPFALILITMGIIKIKKNQIFLIIILFLLPNIVESLFFYSHFDKRETVFKHSVAGKIFILSGKDSFKISDYPKNLQNLLTASKKEFIPIHQYLDNIDNIFLKSELLSDYEVVAQYQTFNLQSVKKINFDNEIFFDNSSKIFIQVLKNNLPDYLILSFYHYLGNWSIGSKVRLLNENKNLIPKYNELEKSSGPMNLPSFFLIELAQYFFFILLFILTLYSLLSFLSFFRIIKKKMTFESVSLIFLIQSYLILVCLTNVSTPRYLMPVYIPTLMIIVDFFNLIKKKYNS